ncbi:MAG: DMT family transporter [Myxococcales bacterium]|nr:DMT family transporter [Myxococcales bacterium]
MSPGSKGVLLMVLASGCFTSMSALVKALGPQFPFVEAAFFRALFGLPMVLALLVRKHVSLRSDHKRLMLVRGLAGSGAMGCYFFALQHGKLAEVIIVARTHPVLVAIIAPLILAERTPRVVFGVMSVSFVGVALVIKPSAGDFSSAALVAFAATCFSAVAHTLVRKLRASEPPERIVIYLNVIVGVAAGVASLPVFVWPSWREVWLLVGVAALATVGQLSMTHAYGHDKAPVISTAGHAGILFALGIGWIAWREVPDTLSLVGGGLILAAGVSLAFMRRETLPPSA